MTDVLRLPIAQDETADLLYDFGQLAELNYLIRENPISYNGAAEMQREEMVSAMALRIIGRSVLITQLEPPASEIERPITRYGAANQVQAEYLVATNRHLRRTYEGTNQEYLPYDTMRHRRFTRGKVLDIDAAHESLVILPRGLRRMFDRDWARMVSPDGLPLVELALLK